MHRAKRGSYKLDLALPGGVQIELFSFRNSPRRMSHPEACGLRHLAFEVVDIDQEVAALMSQGVPVEEVRLDALTRKRFTFFSDPDGLSLEPYERGIAGNQDARTASPFGSGTGFAGSRFRFLATTT